MINHLELLFVSNDTSLVHWNGVVIPINLLGDGVWIDANVCHQIHSDNHIIVRFRTLGVFVNMTNPSGRAVSTKTWELEVYEGFLISFEMST